ncbi:MAG: T9SS type A sorting domain-containing protein [Saprospiraceae bacterium]|nr:T9SS type A sorting domain-containing protein [Candidatus Vicinibacter affinis]
MTGIINNQYQIVELNHLPAGVYIVTIHNNFKQYTEKKIIL